MWSRIAFDLSPEHPGRKRDIAQWSAGGPSVNSEDSHAQVIGELECRRHRDQAALVVVDSGHHRLDHAAPCLQRFCVNTPRRWPMLLQNRDGRQVAVHIPKAAPAESVTPGP